MRDRDTLYSAWAASSILNLFLTCLSPRALIILLVIATFVATKKLFAPLPPPQPTPTWKVSAIKAIEGKNYSQALTITNKYIKSHPHDLDPYLLRVDIYDRMGNFSAGERSIKEATEAIGWPALYNPDIPAKVNRDIDEMRKSRK